ncbi:MAG TPA: hypothetical protein VKV28_04430 [Candidatus Binataceae bacterium]|nr:hypothetical protein [Candidatus Binataceae bacterium]
MRQGIPLITVRFQAAAPEGRRAHAGIFAGISTTRMRFLEPREVEGKGGDRPRHPPVAILRVPELPLGTLAALTTAHSTFS